MGTVINTNVSAMNSLRSLKVVGGKTSKASEKLSSGLRINRAGDDAAGLAISEKMRSQIKGLNQASRNSQDGISLIQTAEGALQESHDMLQRMRELVVQGSNGTNTKEDREKIALELNELSDELTSISDKTEFNKKKLINGDLSANPITLQTGANEGQTMSFAVGKMSADTLGVTKSQVGALIATGGGKLDGTVLTPTMVAGTAAMTVGTVAHAATYDFGDGQSISMNNKGTVTIAGFGADDGVYTSDEFKEKYANVKSTGKTLYATSGAQAKITSGGLTIQLTASAGATVASKNTLVTDITPANSAPNASKTASLQGIKGASVTGYSNSAGALTEVSFSGISKNQIAGSGVTDAVANKIAMGEKITMSELNNVVITSKDGTATQTFVTAGTSTFNAGAKTIRKSGESPEPSASAMGNVLKKVDNAIATVSEQRAKLGAYQNRLEHTINNLDTSSENLSAAESRVRDTDLAKEMIEFTKSNVLSQAAQSMLAQANQAPNQVLQLLG